MATGTAGTTAMFLSRQHICYVRKAFAYTDGAAATLTIGTIPAGSMILLPISGVLVTTVFNAGTTNVLDIGITGTLEKYASDLALGTLAFVPLDVTNAAMYVTADTPLILTMGLAGTAATTGAGIAVIAFIPNVDN